MVVAFKEFSGITHSTIQDLRLKNKDAVLNNIENFAKRTVWSLSGNVSRLGVAGESAIAHFDIAARNSRKAS